MDTKDPPGDGDFGAAIYDDADGAGVCGEVLFDEASLRSTKDQAPTSIKSRARLRRSSKSQRSCDVWSRYQGEWIVGRASLILLSCWRTSNRKRLKSWRPSLKPGASRPIAYRNCWNGSTSIA